MVKNKYIIVKIALHPTQILLIEKFKRGEINFEDDTLRGIAKKIKLGKESPQQIKHHLEQLVKLGILNKIAGQYRYAK